MNNSINAQNSGAQSSDFRGLAIYGWWQGNNLGDNWIRRTMEELFPGAAFVPTSNWDFTAYNFLLIGGGGLFPCWMDQKFVDALTLPYGTLGLGGEFGLRVPAGVEFVNRAEFLFLRDQYSLDCFHINNQESSFDITFARPLPLAEKINWPKVLLVWRETPDLDPQFAQYAGVSAPLATYQKILKDNFAQVIENDFQTSGSDIEGTIGDCGLVVSARYHGIVAAIQKGIPCIAIDVCPKLRVLMHDCGLEEYCLKPGGVDKLDQLIQQIKSKSSEIQKLQIAYRTKAQKTLQKHIAFVKVLIDVYLAPESSGEIDQITDQEQFKLKTLQNELRKKTLAHNSLQRQSCKLEQQNSFYRQMVQDIRSNIALQKGNFSNRIAKLLQIFRNPELAGASSRGQLLCKMIKRKQVLAENYSIFFEIERILQQQDRNNHLVKESYTGILGFAGKVSIFATVPYDDIGGGQRSAQLTRCLLERLYQVEYFYKYPKTENGVAVAGEYSSKQLLHGFFDTRSITELTSGWGRDSVVIFEFPHPGFLPILLEAKQRGVKTVYEAIDPWETSLGANWYSENVEKQFVSLADKVVATSKVLCQRLERLGRSDVLYCPNAADERYFGSGKAYSKPTDIGNGYQKTILYFGSMWGEWFDWEFLKRAAECNPDTEFMMLGDRPEITMPKNVNFAGLRQNAELEAYLKYSNAAIIPFIPGPLVDAVSPVKVFEYLFAGVPVITSKMIEITDYPGVWQAGDAEEFAQLCKLEEIAAPSEPEREKFISQNNWNSRADWLLQERKLHFTYSIIILIHNNADIITRILSTLKFHARDIKLEVIVVDNASEDGGAELVERLFGNFAKVVRNPQNGCSSGRNLGAAHATGEILVFFDSDQYFTSINWLYECDFLLHKNADIGAFGWSGGWFDNHDLGGRITDYLPNRGRGNEEYLLYGFRTDIHYLATSGFFIRRKLFEEIGAFDVEYDPTIFEDTDLSMKVRNAGLKLAFRDFTGIGHRPHQTTKASERSPEYLALWQRNKSLMERKWHNLLDELTHF